MSHAVALLVLGHHRCEVAGVADQGWFDGVDLLVRDDAGREVVLGFRTGEYVTDALEHGDPDWLPGAPGAGVSAATGLYRPLPIALDPSSIRHWDFGRVLWVGPTDDHPCLVWSNAEALSVAGLWTLLGPEPLPTRTGGLLAGPDGAGLPTPEEIGVVVPGDRAWVGYSP